MIDLYILNNLFLFSIYELFSRKQCQIETTLGF